ncbi:MAG: histidine kinase [Chloroflexales bacterium]|nr:histidine kinase [Chloroflexales bacterium]
MNNNLQQQLIRSHFHVTLVSVLSLAVLVLAGYYLYLQTPYPAHWAGLNAADYADELAYLSEVWDKPVDTALAQDYLREITDAALFEANGPLADHNQAVDDEAALGWLILAPDGAILATDNPVAFPVGRSIHAGLPPGLQPHWLAVPEGAVNDPAALMRYGQQAGFHVGFAPMLDSQDKLLGWLYFRAYDTPTAVLLTRTAIQLGAILLGAVLLAILVAGMMGRRIAQRFDQRLQQVTAASAALAAGAVDQRVPVEGDDAIAQLGGQFNRMADQLTAQMGDLRQLADANAQRAQESRSLAALEERNHLARDLHDAIKQKLFGLNLTISALQTMQQAPQQAAGVVDQQAPVAGDDTISQLGTQFSRMADQLTAQMHDLRQLADANTQRVSESRSLAALEERNHLARDLHDAIKQKLFGLNLTVGALQTMLQQEPQQVVKRLEQLSQTTADVIAETDLIINELRPAALDHQGLVPALSQLIEQWKEQTGIPVSFAQQGARELPLSIEYVFYRITQEALTNVRKHAQAERVELVLAYDVDEVRLSVCDDGQGGTVDARRASTSLGIASMAARVTELGGSFHVKSAPGAAGTHLEIRVPLQSMG